MTRHSRVQVGRVYERRTIEDGARMLVDHLWPRGLTNNQADLDEWCNQITPSAAPRRWHGHDPDLTLQPLNGGQVAIHGDL